MQLSENLGCQVDALDLHFQPPDNLLSHKPAPLSQHLSSGFYTDVEWNDSTNQSISTINLTIDDLGRRNSQPSACTSKQPILGVLEKS